MQQKLRALAVQFEDKIPPALRAEAELIMTRSKDEFVPIDQGTLKNSGRVLGVEKRGQVLSVKLTYGGAASAYALAIHEHLSAHSPRSWRKGPVKFTRGGPGYLRKPLNLAAPGLAKRIATRIGV